jgi:hypothetical protein
VVGLCVFLVLVWRLCVCVCVCVCVCDMHIGLVLVDAGRLLGKAEVGERKREREREKDREKDREREGGY